MEDSPLAGRRQAAAILRDLGSEIVTADLDDQAFFELSEHLEIVRQRLASQPRLQRDVEGLHTADHAAKREGREPLYDRDPMIGLSNPLAPPLRRASDQEDENIWEVTFGDTYAGHPGLAHGGYVAAVIDHVLGVAASGTGIAAMTGTLTTRFCRPTPLHTRLLCRGTINSVKAPKVFCSATLEADGVVVAEGEGIFFQVQPDRFESPTTS